MERTNWELHIRDWLFYLKFEKNRSENTLAAYHRDILKLTDSLPEDSDPETIQAEDLSAFLAASVAPDHAASSQARLISALRSFFSYLQYAGVREDSPASLLDLPKKEIHYPDYLEIDEIEAMISAIDRSTLYGERDYAMTELLYGCGLRVSELTHLRRSSYFEKESLLSVLGKGGKYRIVPLPLHTEKVLQHYITNVRVHFPQNHETEDVLFLNYKGGRISRVSVFKLIKNLAAKAKITKKIYPHSLRHSYATHLLRRGVSIRYIQTLLGHASLSTTEIYTHIENPALVTAMRYHPRNSTEKTEHSTK